MTRGEVELKLNLQQISGIHPFVLVLDRELNAIWASAAVLKRNRHALGLQVSALIASLDPAETLSYSLLAAGAGQYSRMNLLGDHCVTPLAGFWLSWSDGVVLFASPAPADLVELAGFRFDDFPPNDRLVELYVAHDETRRSIEEAAEASQELKLRNKKLEQSEKALEEKLKEMQLQRRAVMNMMRDTEQARRELEALNTVLHGEITERRRIDEALAREKERLITTLKSIGDGVIVTDNDDRIVLINDAARELLGISIDAIGTDIHGHIRDEEFVEIWRSAKVAEQDLNKVRVQPEGSKDRVLSATRTAIQALEQSKIGDVTIFHDITKEVEVDRMKTDFVSSVSHELRTPLTSIKGFATTILKDPEMPTELRMEFIGIINEESQRLAALIDDLLDIARIESGRFQLKQEAVLIEDLLKRASSAFAPQMREKSLSFECRREDYPAEIVGDRDKLYAVLVNLLSNALKFTPKGKGICLSTRRQGSFAVIEVSDTGMGIPAKDLDRIFSRFFRVYRPGMEIQGTGLGLSISKEIVEKHGGTIEVESAVGEGTTFRVLLPLAQSCQHEELRHDEHTNNL